MTADDKQALVELFYPEDWERINFTDEDYHRMANTAIGSSLLLRRRVRALFTELVNIFHNGRRQ